MMTVTSAQNVYVHSSPPKAISGQGAAIRSYIRNGDLDKLESVILEGQGARLLGLMESTTDPKVKAFLKSVPSYMAKVDLIHDAVIRGSLRETQALLDKRKLVVGRDAVGRGLAHKAVLYNHKSLLDWLGRKFPEVVHLRDNEGRTPLHYTSCHSPSTDLYNHLLTLGASPDTPDIHGKKPSYYQSHPQDLDIESPLSNHAPHPHPPGGHPLPPRSFSRNKLSQRKNPISPTGSHSSGTTPPGNSVTRAQIRIWIHEKDVSKLEQIVWDGQGDKLLLETTNNSKVRRFLDNVPHLLGIIRAVHASAVGGDVGRLKQLKETVGVQLREEVFLAKDQYGVDAVMKAAGLNHRQVVEFFAYEFPEGVKTARDAYGRSLLDYSPNPAMSSFLGKLMSEVEPSGNELTEVDVRRLRMLPDAPRVVGMLGEWDRGSGRSESREAQKYLKRKQSSAEEFGLGDGETLSAGERYNSTALSAGNKVIKREEILDQLVNDQEEGQGAAQELEEQINDPREDEEDDKDIVDVGEDYVVDEQVAPSTGGGKYNLEPGAIVLEGMDFHVDDDPRGEDQGELQDEGEEEKELEKELERIHAHQEEEEEESGIMEEERMVLEEELNAELPRTPTPMPHPQPHLSARGLPTPRKTAGSSKNKILEPELEDVPSAEELSENVDELIEQGNMEALVTLVLEGKGALLLNKETSSSTHPEVLEFLTNVPAYMAKIASIHSAANNGNLRELQSLLDRKRLALARDENGRVALHMAVLGGHANIVRYLIQNYGVQSTNTRDSNQRTPLHYAATLPDQGTIYKVLIQSGADPNVRDHLDNTPGVYLRRKDLLSQNELLEFKPIAAKGGEVDATPASGATVETWERPPSPVAQQIQAKVEPINPEMELDPAQLTLLESFYTEISSKESSWIRTWRKLTKKGNDLAKIYVQKYLPRELFEEIKYRVTPRFGATLLDCIKFYPQYFLIAPDPHAYFVWREVFLSAVKGLNGVEVMKGCLLGGASLDTSGISVVDVAAKFVREVRVRVSRNLRPYPFVSLLRKEGLDEVVERVETALRGKFESWERVEWEGLINGGQLLKEEREESGRGVIVMEATKISRFWPKSRIIWISPENNAQIWIHAQDHLDFIVRGRYGRVGPLLELLKTIYDKVGVDLDYHYNSEVGFLTVDPFRCGTGMKITFRLRLPHLMKNKGLLLPLLESHSLCISKWVGSSGIGMEKGAEVDLDDYIEIENVKTFGLDEIELATGVVTGVNDLIKVEEAMGREEDLRQTKK